MCLPASAINFPLKHMTCHAHRERKRERERGKRERKGRERETERETFFARSPLSSLFKPGDITRLFNNLGDITRI